MFGLNNAQLIGRLGADATISHLTNGGRVANVSIATDESYPRQKLGGQGGPHRVAPHRHLPGRPGGDDGEAREEGPPGLRLGQAADPQVAQGRRGQRPVQFSTEILLVPGGRVQFLDKPKGNGTPSMNGDSVPSAQTAATVDDNEIPF